MRTLDRRRSGVRAEREGADTALSQKFARFRYFRDGTRLALAKSMVHSSPVSSARTSLSLAPAARATVFAPVLIAALSVCSVARAQEPSSNAGTESASPEPSSQPLPATSPSATEPALPPTATTANQAPAAGEAAPSPPPVALTPASDERSLRLPSRVHQGFYLRFTSGPSFLTLRGHGPSGASASLTDSGAGGSIAIGGAIMPGLVLAGTLQGTAFNADFKGGPFADATVTANGKTVPASHDASGGFGMLGVLVDWYPQPTGNWHAGFSTGVGAVALTNSADGSNLTGVNFAGSVFGGYDWSLGRNWSLGLQLVASGGTRAKMKEDFDSDDAIDTGYRLTPFSLGVQASLLYF
jgi:hypothetical protein